MREFIEIFLLVFAGFFVVTMLIVIVLALLAYFYERWVDGGGKHRRD